MSPIYVFIPGGDSTADLTGGDYIRPGASPVSFISVVLSADNSTHSDGKWYQVGNRLGTLYRLDLPDAALASGARSVDILATDANNHSGRVTIDIVGYDPTAANLPANVTQIDGVNNGTHASGYIGADVRNFGGSVGTFSSGRPEVNTTHLAGTPQTGRDIGASVLLSSGTGTGQLLLSSGNIAGSVGSISGITFPTGFSGLTITSGRVNADVTHWLGTAAATPTVGGVPEVDITHVLGTEVCH
jgi:hypothetical protein